MQCVHHLKKIEVKRAIDHLIEILMSECNFRKSMIIIA